ncbi:MAG: IclR family transcriptional regulator [Actinobacteria bacterium]|nr:IclR family transcriptional regulator [Actinomycetota bacterium]
MGNTIGGVGVLDKAVDVLNALEVRSLSLSELVGVTGLPRATAHRLATALERHGLVRRDVDGRFMLGTRLLSLGQAAADAWPLATAAASALAILRDETGESVQLFVRDGEERVCIAALQSLHGLRTIVPLGARLPLSAGSAARVLTSADQTAGEWIESVGEREAGVASVSAPVRDASGRVVAAVSVSGPIERTSRQPGKRYGSFVVRAAREIESEAGLRGVDA